MKLMLLYLGAVVVLAGATRMDVNHRKLIDALESYNVVDRAFESELRALLEQLRELIGTGDPENGIPVLDPFEYKEANFSYQIPATADINLSLKDLLVTGLQGFVVDEIDFSIIRLRMSFDFTIPSIKASFGFYNLLAKIIDFDFFGQGDGQVEVINLRFHGAAFLSIRGGKLNMNRFDIKFIMEAFKSEVNGLLGGGEVGMVINEILQELVPALVESQGEQLSAAVEEIVMAIANPILNELTLQDLIDIITGGGGGSGQLSLY